MKDGRGIFESFHRARVHPNARRTAPHRRVVDRDDDDGDAPRRRRRGRSGRCVRWRRNSNAFARHRSRPRRRMPVVRFRVLRASTPPVVSTTTTRSSSSSSHRRSRAGQQSCLDGVVSLAGSVVIPMGDMIRSDPDRPSFVRAFTRTKQKKPLPVTSSPRRSSGCRPSPARGSAVDNHRRLASPASSVRSLVRSFKQ